MLLFAIVTYKLQSNQVCQSVQFQCLRAREHHVSEDLTQISNIHAAIEAIVSIRVLVLAM
jgi:hypothetical protein